MLDDQSDQLFAMIDPVAERTRKLGGTSLHSIGDISRNQRLPTTTCQISRPRQCSRSSS